MQLGMFALPSSFVNSSLDYLNKELAIDFRGKLTKHFNN